MSILKNGQFQIVLPRFSYADIGSADFLYQRDAINRFNFSISCQAQKFADNNSLLIVPDMQKQEGCKLIAQIDDAVTSRSLSRTPRGKNDQSSD